MTWRAQDPQTRPGLSCPPQEKGGKGLQKGGQLLLSTSRCGERACCPPVRAHAGPGAGQAVPPRLGPAAGRAPHPAGLGALGCLESKQQGCDLLTAAAAPRSGRGVGDTGWPRPKPAGSSGDPEPGAAGSLGRAAGEFGPGTGAATEAAALRPGTSGHGAFTGPCRRSVATKPKSPRRLPGPAYSLTGGDARLQPSAAPAGPAGAAGLGKVPIPPHPSELAPGAASQCGAWSGHVREWEGGEGGPRPPSPGTSRPPRGTTAGFGQETQRELVGARRHLLLSRGAGCAKSGAPSAAGRGFCSRPQQTELNLIRGMKPQSNVWIFPARTLSPCYSADLRPASESLVSAVGCTVLLTAPPLRASEAVSWERRSGPREGAVVSYAFDGAADTARPYENRTAFNETDFSLRIVLRRGDDGLYRFRSESEATGWLRLRVVEPLSEPEIVGNSSVKEGGNAKLVCNVLEGKVDLFRWKKNGELLPESDRLQFVDNSTLCIVKASMNDSGYYACVVRNEVSQNETSFLLHVQNAADVVLPVILACVAVGSLAGVFVWCRRRDRPCRNGCR
ncbi:uncharacterized protein VSU04_008718 [Chlamydotis macqueenii]